MEMTPRMAKRIRAARYSQDRKDLCLICNKEYTSCKHSWADVQRACRFVYDSDHNRNWTWGKR